MNIKSKYDKYPVTFFKQHKPSICEGYEAICNELKNHIFNKKNKFVLVFDCYPGVDDDEVLTAVKRLNPDVLINMYDLFKNQETIAKQLQYQLTDDRVFGKMYAGEINDFLHLDKLEKAKELVEKKDGLIIVYGFGASLVTTGNILVYLDLARWEIQLRYRKGMGNYKADNGKEDILKKYKRGFFVEWRIADKHKSRLFDSIDYLLDTNRVDHPKMITGAAFRAALTELSRRPFRTVPYFDPGVWGGQWLKEICGLDQNSENFAWSFDGVPEENSLLLGFGDCIVEIPAMDVVLYRPKELLGEQVYARFGAEFPIRFDFLDTMDGDNLSLQVHPLTEYIKKQFGMQYTQDESYYILDAKEGAVVYLGLREGIDKERMISELRQAQETGIPFMAEKYVNQYPAKKHDHFLIPAGTVHCSGKDTMVLEISATPYIFTFKLWDWGRLGLDGKPRPIHIEHGEKVIQWDRTETWVSENLVNQIYTIHEENGYIEEHTGLHELEFIETRRFWINKKVQLDTNGTVWMFNLVEGEGVVIESQSNEFPPFTIHYAETFIIPASVGGFTIRPAKEGGKIGLIGAYVRDCSGA